MSSRTFYERCRISLSWAVVIVLVPWLVVAGSKWENIPVLDTLLFTVGCTLAGIASLGRLWCSLYISGYKNNTLVMVGPYSLCRNPLYFFSLIGCLGVGLATETFSIPLILLLFFSAYYPRVIKSEEARLQALHKESFESYRRRTPAFFPSIAQFREPEEYWVKPRIFRRNLLDAVWFVWLIGIVELIESLHKEGIVPVLFTLY